jgi:hypothetical protein
MHEPLIIGRFLNPETQAHLARTASRTAKVSLTEAPFRTLTNNQAGVRLVTEQQYKKALRHPYGSLGELSTEETKGIIEENIRQTPAESGWLLAETKETRCRPIGKLTVISYALELIELDDGNDHFTALIDRINGINTRWGRFNSRLTVAAMLPENEEREAALTEAFEAVRPNIIALSPAQVVTASDLAPVV